MLDPDQQRECREIGREIVREAMREHIASCPHGHQLEILKAKVIGFACGCSVLGASVMFGLAKLFGL